MNLFKSKKSEPAQGPGMQTFYDPFSATRQKFSDWLGTQIGQPGPKYTGERVAPMSDLEKKSLDAGQEYAAAPSTGANYALASDEIKKTLSGDYDPSTSPYYQAVKAEAEQNLKDTNLRIANSTSGARRAFSGVRQQLEGRAATDVNIQLDKTLGALSEAERARRLQAVPLALSADKQQSDATFNKATGLQQIGALPRELDQASLDAAFEQFMNENYQYPLNIGQLASGPSQQEPLFIQTGYTRRKPSFTTQLLSLFQ